MPSVGGSVIRKDESHRSNVVDVAETFRLLDEPADMLQVTRLLVAI